MAKNVYKRDFFDSGKFLALLAIPFGLLALPLFVIAYLHLSTILSPPVYSASVSIPELGTTIKLDFYMVWDETQVFDGLNAEGVGSKCNRGL